MAKSRRSLSLSLVRCVVFTLTALLISTIPLIADSIDERIKVLEVELQKAMKSTYLPNDEQLSRIKKELDLLKMQQELDSIKSKRTQIPQIQEKQIPQYYESQTSQTQDSRFDWANQSNYQETKAKEYRVSNYNGNATTRSGYFFGIEAGYVEARGSLLLTHASIIKNPLQTGQQIFPASSFSTGEKKGGVNYGVMMGYAHFFNNYFGGRIYGSLNALHIKFSNEGIESVDTLLSALYWGMNVDLIANFVALRNFDMGVYVGVFLGANTFLETGYTDYIVRVSEMSGFKVSRTHFDIALNVGLRTMIAKNVGLEVALRVPFLKSYAVNEDAYNLQNGAYMGVYQIYFKQNYNVNLRLLYKF